VRSKGRDGRRAAATRDGVEGSEVLKDLGTAATGEAKQQKDLENPKHY
jgi:hypothetical protein